MAVFLPGRAFARRATQDGLFITVDNPITDDAVRRIKVKINDAIQIKKRSIKTIVFDFNPAGNPSGTSEWGSSQSLAYFIRDLQLGYENYPKISTVAFVHNEVSGHTVLPVLACKQIVMSMARDESTRKLKARIGDVLRNQTRELPGPVKKAYQEIGQPYGDLVDRMLYKNFVLKKVRTTDGTFYLGLDTIAQWKKDGKIFTVDDDVPGLELGSTMFDTELAQRVGLCQATYNTRAELKTALHLPHQSLVEDWTADRTVVAWRIEVKGGLDKGSLDSLTRRIKNALSRNANFIILHLDSSGGETQHASAVAAWLKDLKDNNDHPVRTVAYIPSGAALGAATFLALGCTEIVMAEDAALADFNYLRDASADELKSRRDMLVPLAQSQGYPPLLFEATLDKSLVLYRAKSITNPADERLLTQEEMDKDKASPKPRWLDLGRLDHPQGQFLKITAPLAREWGIAQQSSNINNVDELYAHYGLDSFKVQLTRDDWLDQVAEFFRAPLAKFFLIMLGIIGLILELKMPGATVPGVMAAVCFVLFFWAYSFVGEFTLLAVLLFVLGLILLGIEIFVIPGFGFTGISGLVLILTSLTLVTLEKMPSTTQDWVNLAGTLSTFGLSLVAAIVVAMMVAWFLPSIPFANRLVLEPPVEDALGDSQAPGAAPAALLGAIGLAVTTLRPAGKAQFGDDFYDVVAEGDYVSPGSRVQVIEIEGNRVVVKEI